MRASVIALGELPVASLGYSLFMLPSSFLFQVMPKYEGSFVFNCMGGDPAVGPAKLICARQATLNYWPQLRDAVLGLGAE